MSANLYCLHATVEVGGPYQCDGAALQGHGLHLHAVRHHSNRLMAGLVGGASFSPVLLKLQVIHVQNAAEKHIAFSGAGRSHDGNNLSSIFPELLRSQEYIAELRERN